jgi:hypothetical protein
LIFICYNIRAVRGTPQERKRQKERREKMKRIFDFLAFILGADCKIKNDSVEIGICDFGGQGRNKYGK